MVRIKSNVHEDNLDNDDGFSPVSFGKDNKKNHAADLRLALSNQNVENTSISNENHDSSQLLRMNSEKLNNDPRNSALNNNRLDIIKNYTQHDSNVQSFENKRNLKSTCKSSSLNFLSSSSEFGDVSQSKVKNSSKIDSHSPLSRITQSLMRQKKKNDYQIPAVNKNENTVSDTSNILSDALSINSTNGQNDSESKYRLPCKNKNYFSNKYRSNSDVQVENVNTNDSFNSCQMKTRNTINHAVDCMPLLDIPKIKKNDKKFEFNKDHEKYKLLRMNSEKLENAAKCFSLDVNTKYMGDDNCVWRVKNNLVHNSNSDLNTNNNINHQNRPLHRDCLDYDDGSLLNNDSTDDFLRMEYFQHQNKDVKTLPNVERNSEKSDCLNADSSFLSTYHIQEIESDFRLSRIRCHESVNNVCDMSKIKEDTRDTTLNSKNTSNQMDLDSAHQNRVRINGPNKMVNCVNFNIFKNMCVYSNIIHF
eukprot:GHVL01027228.1.p1 GENE.GHVL01027228.1~~GHVL01027228.1.p1  ORF type:complete len:513 (-),score=69.26 GHVL01027228.1:2246-3673(-)